MERIEALKALAEKVEDGQATEFTFMTWAPGLSGTKKESRTMFRAYNGSLDAAKALHEAVLPGWDYIIGHTNEGLTVHAQVGPDVQEFGDSPARAWLLAIIRALIAQEEANATNQDP